MHASRGYKTCCHLYLGFVLRVNMGPRGLQNMLSAVLAYEDYGRTAYNCRSDIHAGSDRQIWQVHSKYHSGICITARVVE